MYHGLHPNANPLQQTYDQLQNRAIQELNDEIARLKDIIGDKDGEIVKLKEITNQGTLQKKLANVLEENNNLKLQLKEYQNNKQLIKEINESLNSKNDEIYRQNEKMNLLNDEYKELMNKNKELNKELIEKTQIIQESKQKDDEIVQLNKKIAEFTNLIHDLKNATKVNDLESEIKQMKHEINTMQHEKEILSENNKHLITTYDEIKAKYTKLLNDFDKNMEQNQLISTKHIDSLHVNMNDLKQKYNSEKHKNNALKQQMKDLQQSFKEMEGLNLKLIKGYNLEDVINDLQHAKNQNLNLQNEIKQITKQLSQKEKTNLVLLNRNKVLTQTLSIDNDLLIQNDEESTHFDHVEQIQFLQEKIQNLHKKIDKLESDKYKLLTQIHENNDENDQDSLAFSGLNKQQRNKIKRFVQKIRKQSLMPTYFEDDEDEDEEHRVQILKKENETLREWKDTLMTKLFETQPHKQQHTMNAMDTMLNKEEVEVNNTQQPHIMNTLDTNKEVLFNCVSKEKLQQVLAGVNDDNCAEIKQLMHDQSSFIDVVLHVMNDEALQNIQNIDVLIDNNDDKEEWRQMKKENEALNDEIDSLQGYKLRHAKIEKILKEKNDSELIKKVDQVSKENMVLIVNQKKLSKKYVDLKKQQKYLFIQYKKLLHYLMETEKYLWDKLSLSQCKNENLSIFINELLQNISNKMVPLDEYKNIEIECQSLYQTKDHLLSILHRFETFSIQYFHCKRDKIQLEHQLIDTQAQNKEDGDEIIHNAELVDDNDDKPQIKASMKTTQEEYQRTRKKYEHAMSEIKELEANSAKLHDQIAELRTICLDQSDTISSLKKQQLEIKNSTNEELQSRFDKLKTEYESKLVEITQMKQKTEFAVSSLQTLQTKIICALDIDIEDDDTHAIDTIEQILKKTQNVNHTEAVNKQKLKSSQDKICSLEVEILKIERKYNELQSQHFNTQKAKRFLEANFNCVYSKTLHKMSSKYLSEIDHLRHTNEELYEYLHEEQTKTKDIYDDMVDHKILIESFKVKVENMNTLMHQYEDDDFKDSESSKKYVKNWQNKCTNLEIKQIELLNNNESLQNEIGFLRNENKKYIANIGSLQKKLSISHQELQDTKHEMIKKYNAYQLEALQEKISVETEAQSVQTDEYQHNDNNNNNASDDKQKMYELQNKVVSLQNLIKTLQNESIHTEERVNGATEGLQIMLKTAQESIQSLQTLVVQKNESIEEYKQMMDKLLKKLKEQQAKYAQHIVALKMKHNVDQKENEEMIAVTAADQHQISHYEWVQFSEMKTTLQQKENMMKALQERNAKLMIDEQENETKIEILNTRIDEYHQVIQELNDKVLNLSDSLRAFKTKLNAKKKENLHLQKAVKTLKEKMEKKRDNTRIARNDDNQIRNEEAKDNEMDDKMRNIENEYKALRASLRFELDENTQKLSETQFKRKQLMTKNNDLIREVEKLKNNLQNKSNVVHKLQLQVSKTQKDKIAQQEKHSVTLKINKKRINNLEKTVKTLEKRAECDQSQLTHFMKKVDEKQSETNKLLKLKKTHQKEIAQLKKEIESKQLCDEMQEETQSNKEIEEELEKKILKLNKDASRLQIENKKLNKDLNKLRMENKSMKRKYELVRNDDNYNDKEIAKLFDEIENKENIIIDLETKINELKYEKEDLEIKYKKIQKQSNKSKVTQVSSRNDPQLQNLLDSMRFIINKLKKENQTLKDNQKNQKQSLRITNLLKENKSLKKQTNELQMKQMDEYEIEQKQLEIERITNLSKRLKKENLSLKERNEKYLKSDAVKKNQEITHLKKIIEEERSILSQRVSETEMIWKRKISMTNDDLLRYKKIKKDLESEVKHKNEINQKMSEEIKALIELIDHTKHVSNQQNESEKMSTTKLNKQIQAFKKENDALRSELSAFDVSFFNEIEDLKYREAQAQQMIIELQSKLQQVPQ